MVENYPALWKLLYVTVQATLHEFITIKTRNKKAKEAIGPRPIVELVKMLSQCQRNCFKW